MTDSAPDQERPVSDLKETIAFLKASPGYVEGLTEEGLQGSFNALPTPVRRLLLNFAAKEWSEALALMQKLGVEDPHSLDSVRPLVERFKPLASTVFERMKAKQEFRKEYAGVDAIKAKYLFEMSVGIPILHLQFLDESEKVLFESRETTPGMMSNALGITVAVNQSLELCRQRNLNLSKSLVEHVKGSLTSLLEEVKGIAIALNIPESELLDALSGSKSSERANVEENVKSE